MIDLIYGGREYQEELISLFPAAKITDASDDIHFDRIEINIPDIEEKEYWRIIILNGFFNLSLNLQLSSKIEDKAKLLSDEIDKWKKEYPEYFKNQ